jgi:hypothetical protein
MTKIQISLPNNQIIQKKKKNLKLKLKECKTTKGRKPFLKKFLTLLSGRVTYLTKMEYE